MYGSVCCSLQAAFAGEDSVLFPGRTLLSDRLAQAIVVIPLCLVSDNLPEAEGASHNHELKNKNSNLKGMLTIATCIIGLLMLVIICLLILHHKSRSGMNRILKEKNEKEAETEEPVRDIEAEQDVPVALAPESDKNPLLPLFQQLCRLMDEEMLFRNPKLNQTTLCKHLYTNHTYLTEAIRLYGGVANFNEFVNNYRLRYAGTLLTNHPEIPINEIETSSGFRSRSTFNRCFLQYYGMSPSAYRLSMTQTSKIN